MNFNLPHPHAELDNRVFKFSRHLLQIVATSATAGFGARSALKCGHDARLRDLPTVTVRPVQGGLRRSGILARTEIACAKLCYANAIRAAAASKVPRLPAALLDLPSAFAAISKLGASLVPMWTERALKRIADLVAALAALILLAPVLVLIAALVKSSMGGPVVYAHWRVGRGGHPFKCFKFRSMIQNSDKVLERHLASSPEAQKEWAESHKLRDDPRITELGSFLRCSSIDELPQLFNVVLGDMSLVGPRPIVAAELAKYEPYAGEYLSVRPGITGLWQVTGRSKTSYVRRVALDRYYARRWSLGLDLGILLSTIPALLRAGEAH